MENESAIRLKAITHFLGLEHEDFLLQFRTHPNFPSAMSLSDTLNNLGIATEAFMITKQNNNQWPHQFITIQDNYFTLVSWDNKKKFHKIFNKNQKLLEKDFFKESDRKLVISFLNDVKRSSKVVITKVALLYGIVVSFFLITSYFLDIYHVTYNFLSLAGIFISSELYKTKIKGFSFVINKLCSFGKREEVNQSGCSKVIAKDDIKIFELKLSDWSLYYFITIFIFGTVASYNGMFLKSLSIISCAVVMYSVVHQVFYVNKICLICMLINVLLLIQCFISSIYFYSLFNTSNFLISAIVSLLILLLFKFFDQTLTENIKLKHTLLKSLKFRRNFDFFRTELLKNEPIVFKDSKTFLIGSEYAKIRIQVVTSPYCKHCHHVHGLLRDFTRRFPEEISVQCRFTFLDDETINEFFSLMKIIKHVYKQKADLIFDMLDDWTKIKNINKLNKKYLTEEQSNEKVSMTDIIEVINDNRNKGLAHTPVLFINGLIFPDKYDYEDLQYFIYDLIENRM